jgi:hypothetical protein
LGLVWLIGREAAFGTYLPVSTYVPASVGAGTVPTPEEYQHRAEECVRLARADTDTWAKVMLLEMAQTWIKLALKAKGELPPDTES